MWRTLQDLALQELCWLAEGQAALPASWRAAVWADEGGRATWTPLAGCLVGEIRDWLTTLAAALSGAPGEGARPGSAALGVASGSRLAHACTWRQGPEVLSTGLRARHASLVQAAADKAPASGMAKVQWNALALSSSTGTHGVSRAQDLAAWVIRAKFYKCVRAPPPPAPHAGFSHPPTART